MDLTPHVLKGMCVVLASERWNVTTSSLSFFSKWGHRRKMALSSTCNTTLWEDAELSKCHWETEEAGTSLGSRQQCSRLLLYPEIHFSWHWARTERWGKNNFFLKKKNPQNKTKKYLNKATPAPKLSPNESLQKLSGVCQELMFILITQTILKINSPDTIAFLCHICQAQYLSKCSCIKLWNVWMVIHWLCSCTTGKGAPTQPLPGMACVPSLLQELLLTVIPCSFQHLWTFCRVS